jgi:large subunit ribosomal protein L31
MKKWIHAPYYKDVEVNCICGASFKINATVPGPIKVETCYQCHPAFNENKEVKKVIKGRMEKFLEKQEAIKAAQSKKSA